MSGLACKLAERRHALGLKPKVPARALLAATLFLIAVSVPAFAHAPQRHGHSYQGRTLARGYENLLWWLPPDTESIVAARGPFPVPMEPTEADTNNGSDWFNHKARRSEIRVEFEQLPLELFYALHLATSLKGSIIAFAMQGSRHFRDPLPGFDAMDYEGCSIVVFKNALGKRGHKLVNVLAKKATATQSVSGTKVLVFHEQSEHGEWSHYFATPRPDVLLVANNFQYLREILERIAQKKHPRAFPDELSEWRFLDPRVRFWGLRHYDPSQAEQDATSPFGEDRTFGPGDKKAIGILFALDPNDQRTAVMTYLTGDEAEVRDAATTKTAVEEPQAGVKYEVQLRSPTPGVLKRIYTLDQTSTLDYFILTVQVALGRGMYF